MISNSSPAISLSCHAFKPRIIRSEIPISLILSVALDDLKAKINQGNLLNGLCRIGSKIESPGVITHFAADPSIIYGEIDNSKTERTQKILEVFKHAGITARIADDIELEIWKKFLTICSGGLLAVTRSTFGEVRGNPETRQLMMDVFSEIREVAVKNGIMIEADYPDKVMKFIDTLLKLPIGQAIPVFIYNNSSINISIRKKSRF